MYASAAYHLVSNKRASWSRAASGQRMCTPPAGIGKSVGKAMRTRSKSTCTAALDSTISWIVFMPAHTPEKRLMANACTPKSKISCTLDGKNTGVPQALKIWSLWWAAVELLEIWSSPATAITPPQGVVPAILACLKTSEHRSTPGPLPYQIPNTPSYLLEPGGANPSCCVPHSAVAANSSLTPG